MNKQDLFTIDAPDLEFAYDIPYTAQDFRDELRRVERRRSRLMASGVAAALLLISVAAGLALHIL